MDKTKEATIHQLSRHIRIDDDTYSRLLPDNVCKNEQESLRDLAYNNT